MRRKRKKSSGAGCLLLVAIVGLFLFASRNTPEARNSQEGADSDDVGPVFVEVTARPTVTPVRGNQTEPTRRPTNTPLLALTPMWVSSNANARSCASTTCEIVATLPRAEGVRVRTWEHGETISGSDIWYQVEHEDGWVYVHSSLLGFSAPVIALTPLPPLPQGEGGQPQNRDNEPTVVPQAQPDIPMQMPANCTEARAMGLTAQQAAQWDHLDRDDDGEACYGN